MWGGFISAHHQDSRQHIVSIVLQVAFQYSQVVAVSRGTKATAAASSSSSSTGPVQEPAGGSSSSLAALAAAGGRSFVLQRRLRVCTVRWGKLYSQLHVRNEQDLQLCLCCCWSCTAVFHARE
jgi:hypothetical protein